MAGEYTPKYKVGYTVNSPSDETALYIVVGTYYSLGQFSRDYVDGHVDYDNRNAEHVLYALLNPENRCSAWRWENLTSLYCCNSNRGKKLLLEPKSLIYLSELYSIVGEGLVKYTAILNDQSTET